MAQQKTAFKISLFLGIINLLVIIAAARLYLFSYANQVAKEFKAQNVAEIESQNSYLLATRLNAMSNIIHWSCITGKNQGTLFLQLNHSNHCNTGLYQQTVQITSQSPHGIEISLTLRLPSIIEQAVIIFVIIQFLLITGLFIAAHSLGKLEMREKMQLEIAKKEAEIQLGQLAAQVAHDIQSPLAALEIIRSSSQSLEEEHQELLKQVTARIKGIATQLIEQNRMAQKSIKNQPCQNSERLEPVNIIEVVNTIISEKKMQFKHKSNIEFNIYTDFKEPVFVLANTTELLRVFSNLLNNAVEAIENRPELKNKLESISITLKKMDNAIQVELLDSGCGMPESLLKKLGQRGLTQGKAEGSGLGVFHAKSCIERWNGNWSVSSKTGLGTKISFSIPIVKAT